MKKLISILLVVFIATNFTVLSAKKMESVDTAETKLNNELKEKIHKINNANNGNVKISEFTDYEIELLGATAVLIFVAGILVGYLVDGVIIYETGQSAGYWVSEVIRWVSSDSRISKIYVDSNDEVIRAEDNQRCYKSSYSGKWHCQVGPVW
ncbi:hypothetical protein [Ezakiella peruensis]|uniref:hypothetical protein n=1 Tax=Ezakiella peruensis TaxID=1464038 RepID=UPI000C1B060A|nr:hypothetical protein [Ezakiella peruensis]